MTFTKALAEVVGKAGIPYGYTLTVWSTGALCIGRFGLPTPGEVFLFVAGGTLAYELLAVAVTRRAIVRAAKPPAALWENMFAVPAIGATFVLDRLIAARGPNFFLSPLVATFLYLIGVSLLVSRLSRIEEREVHSPQHQTQLNGS